MRGDVIAVSRLCVAESALILGIGIGGAGCLAGEVVATVVGLVLVTLGSVVAWREVVRGEVVTREPTPATAPFRYTNRRRVDGGHSGQARDGGVA